jgi:hypothetical protein
MLAMLPLLKKPLPRKPKETNMQYKTIVLAMIQDRQEFQDQLKKSRMLLATLDAYAMQLKDSHEAWMKRLLQSRPESDRTLIASEALELAVKELEDSLPPVSPPDEDAMAFLHRHSANG